MYAKLYLYIDFPKILVAPDNYMASREIKQSIKEVSHTHHRNTSHSLDSADNSNARTRRSSHKVISLAAWRRASTIYRFNLPVGPLVFVAPTPLDLLWERLVAIYDSGS
jgi:hypothetical protein